MGNYVTDWASLQKGANHYACVNSIWDNGNGDHYHFDSKEELIESIKGQIKYFENLKKEIQEKGVKK